jgi:hypothetical protein
MPMRAGPEMAHGDGVHRFIMQMQHPPRIAQHQIPARGQRQPSPVAVEQRQLQQFLQPLDLQAERGLGDEDLVGGVEHRACVNDGHEAAQQVGRQVDGHGWSF